MDQRSSFRKFKIHRQHLPNIVLVIKKGDYRTLEINIKTNKGEEKEGPEESEIHSNSIILLYKEKKRLKDLNKKI